MHLELRKRGHMSDRVIISIPPLRDGEQALSASLTVRSCRLPRRWNGSVSTSWKWVSPSPPRRFSIGADHNPPHQEQPGLRPWLAPRKDIDAAGEALKVSQGNCIHTSSPLSIHEQS